MSCLKTLNYYVFPYQRRQFCKLAVVVVSRVVVVNALFRLLEETLHRELSQPSSISFQ